MLYIILLAKTLIGLKKTTHQVHSLDFKKTHYRAALGEQDLFMPSAPRDPTSLSVWCLLSSDLKWMFCSVVAQWICNSLWEIGGSHKWVGLNKIIILGSCCWLFISFMSLFDRLFLSCFPPGICHRNFYDLFWDSFKNLSIHLNRTLMFVKYLTIVDYL